MRTLSAALTATVALNLGACGPSHGPDPRSPHQTRPTISVESPALTPIDPAAAAVAEAYVRAAYSYDYRSGPQSWVSQVTPYCTTQWLSAIAHSGDDGVGGWAQITQAHAIATASVLGAYPARSSGGDTRLDITALVSVTGAQPRRFGASLMVGLLFLNGHWLVAWAG